MYTSGNLVLGRTGRLTTHANPNYTVDQAVTYLEAIFKPSELTSNPILSTLELDRNTANGGEAALLNEYKMVSNNLYVE